MSNYLRTTKHPKTGNWETAHWLDDHFGPHQYGVKFEDGTIIAPDFQKGYPETRDDKPEKDWDWQERKAPELTVPLPPEGCTCASFWTVRSTHKKDCPLGTTEPPKTLEQILENSWPEYDQALYELSIADHDVDYLITEAQKLWHKLMSHILAEIQALIEAVIGEDEDLYFGKPHGFNDNFSFNDSANIRNKFRAEQRLRLSKLSRHHPAKGDKSDA